MSESFLAAAAVRHQDAEHWKGSFAIVKLPYLAFATQEVQARICNSVILDARASPLAPFDLHRDGFTFIDRNSKLSSLLPKVLDPHDRPTVTRDAYPAIAHFVEALGSWRDGDGKGRWRAITHSHMHRYTVQCPSFTVHNDYTHADQGPKQVAKVIDGHEASAESAKQLPFFAVNVWTALARVQRDALAVCRWHRGRQLTDMGYADQRYDQDEWYFVPEMCRGEAIVFKQFDSAATTTEVEDTEGIRFCMTLARDPQTGFWIKICWVSHG